ncbi:MAG TPA: sigma-70 family RNA polymerase sigma factor, partial [Gemmatimonadales bacterium]|nr:sigma-70 family RNA polymerase sigma factor [Gemmatimonadales bacterium]
MRETPALSDGVGMYLESVAEHQLLTADDEVRLARAIEQGRRALRKLDGAHTLKPTERAELYRTLHRGEEAKDEFIRSNLRLVISIAKRYTGRGLDLLDLVQEGNLGLIRAVEKFDWRKGFKFSTYATWWIRQAVQRAIVNKGPIIRVPVHVAERERTVARTQDRLAMTLGRPPTDDELARELGLDREGVCRAREATP